MNMASADMEHILYIALGSNLGDRQANLNATIDNFSPQMKVLKKSNVYETPPWGFTDQPAFLNQVVKAETYLQPVPLLHHLKRLETALGRVPSFQNGPRLIDLDILFFDDLVLDSPALKLPHPRLHERAFVLVPLADLEPALVHPVLNRSVSDLLKAVDQSGIQKYEGK
jgi:2-amino-4-hydroxy-6-hydroxymethyldihydropteridine diphosphokinase